MCKTYPLRKKLKRTKGESKGDSVVDINFTVAKNEVLGILGPSGAGKSSIFKIVTLAMNRSGGQVELLNKKLGIAMDANEVLTKGQIGIVYQEDVMWPDMTVD
jgi:ABC-type multidrug transport system ATPase subunit